MTPNNNKQEDKVSKHWTDAIPGNACREAVEYCKTKRSFASAWKDCKRGDWMLWILGRLAGPPESESRKKLVLAACACVRLTLKYVRAGEDRPRLAIEAAEAWARGESGVTIEQVRSAAYAAAYAADAAYAAAAAYAAFAAAAYAAAAAAYAAFAAAYAAFADAAYAAFAAAAYAARTKTLAECADIVRKHYPRPPKMEVKP